MVMLNVRHTVSDYATWRTVFDQDEARRRASGQQGAPQVFRDVDNPNIITVLIPWDSAESAVKFTQDPAMAEAMKKGGVVGMPVVRAILSPA
jgi:heme-degrading monooxygenase HmoA